MSIRGKAYIAGIHEHPTRKAPDCDLEQIRVGQAVRLVFKATDGGPPAPCFTIAG